MPELTYGLNLTKKSGLPPLSSRPAPKKTIFDDDDDDSADEEDEQGGPEAITTLGGLSTPGKKPNAGGLPNKKATAPPTGPPKRKTPQASQYADLSARHTSQKHAEEAQTLDASVYDYDAVYDSLHAKPDKVSGNASNSGPKYMTALIAAAEVRKRDQLRAKEKSLQKEREEEGDAFADKEKFVTGAYKAQQEELQRVEEEERLREATETEKRRKLGGGMTGLYKDLLSREDERHERAMKAAERVAKGDAPKAETSSGTEAKDEAALAKEKGAVVNEDGQIVDKRQLLTAGLNISRKTNAQAADRGRQNDDRDRFASRTFNGRSDAKRDMRERQTRMLETQLAESAKRAAEDEANERDVLEKASKRRATEKDVSSAKERYLARKRAAEAAKAGSG